MTTLILVVGRSGQIASELERATLPPGFTLQARGRDSLDLRRPDAAARAIAESGAAIVVNTAGYTAVDRAETEPDAAYAINRDGAAAVAEGAARARAALIHFSTDYVFDGARPAPEAYREEDPVAPLSVYGASQEAGERVVRARLDRHVILRTAWVYSAVGPGNFVKTMLKLGAERPELKVVVDQRGSPTAASDIVRAVVEIACRIAAGKSDGFGTFHFAGAGATTRFGFAQAIFGWLAAHGRPVPRLVPVPSSAFPTPARRPANSALDCARVGRVYGILPRPWERSLAECMAELFPANHIEGR